jgi:Ca2+-dependent lipid-binding protein
MCVKLNNIEAARTKLDRLYQIMHADEIAQYMRENVTPQNTYKPAKNNFVYTIRVVRAENLQPMDSNGLSDPYVAFEINGKQITKTRTVYETLNPRWEQEFDIWLSDETTVDVLAIVNDEDIITADEECGIVWFKIAPDYFNDFQTHELVLNLSPQGTLVLRISMEGEKNDIQFWFGKAFRTLKRSENDMAELIVDKVTHYI